MKYIKLKTVFFIGIAFIVGITFSTLKRCESMEPELQAKQIKLPDPKYDGAISVEKTLLKRRSVREYQKTPLTLEDVSQILWAAQGETNRMGFRTAPSAGALYPLEGYVVAGEGKGLEPGIYKYVYRKHSLISFVKGDKRKELCRFSLGQSPVKSAPMVLVFTAIPNRTTEKYGQRGIKYIFMEVGHAAQNVCLQAVSLGLGTVVIGAFDDGGIKKLLDLAEEETPIYIVPVGKPANG